MRSESFCKATENVYVNKAAQIASDEKLRDNFMHAKTFIMDSGFIIQTANL